MVLKKMKDAEFDFGKVVAVSGTGQVQFRCLHVLCFTQFFISN